MKRVDTGTVRRGIVGANALDDASPRREQRSDSALSERWSPDAETSYTGLSKLEGLSAPAGSFARPPNVAVRSGLHPAPAAPGGALSALSAQLEALPASALLEPKVQIAFIVQAARELLELLQYEPVRRRLESVGVVPARLIQLKPAIDAVVEAEALWLSARDASKTPRQAEAERLGYSLRDEMVAAIRFNLDGAEARELLARVTDSEDAQELVFDLRELGLFLEEHAAAFVADSSFEPVLCAAEARELSEAIATEAEPAEDAPEALELRDRALTHLCELVEQLRHAGRYAFRGAPEARAYFASDLDLARRRHAHSHPARAIGG